MRLAPESDRQPVYKERINGASVKLGRMSLDQLPCLEVECRARVGGAEDELAIVQGYLRTMYPEPQAGLNHYQARPRHLS
jgi:hypothetical protein